MLKNIADSIKDYIGSRIQNQDALTEQALTAFFACGHILLTGPTGLGKTEWGRSLAQALGVSFNRMRLTDSLQAFELTGTTDRKLSQTELRRGPLFTHVFMADGVENAQQKVQAILMDAMDERITTVEADKYYLPEPFFIIGTHDSARPLPEALADRFMMKIALNYPGVAAEKQMLQQRDNAEVYEPLCSAEAIALAKQEVKAVAVEDAILNYIVSIVETTRRVGAVQTGASPRGSIALLEAAKSYAAIQGRDFVVMDDVRNLALPVLRHRIALKQDAIQEGIQPDRIIDSILAGRKAM